ncbi:hypothetical protein CMV_000392 [Castanea mollissima]|uniref:PDZ domain-containing protein n=1 Tax=Castanea mollissima TaxID=60419 RepID=A0A8J4VYR8_9ROSI|nr:hypothetical protein CMV_000392 [Castanea mollissima]
MYAARRHADCAHKMFDLMVDRDLVAWNSVINEFALNGMPSEALTLFREMGFGGCPAIWVHHRRNLLFESHLFHHLYPFPNGTAQDDGDEQLVKQIKKFGFDLTLTTGVISGLCKEIASPTNGRPIQDVIQTDCAINTGGSGGPLFDSAGSLIGINTAITTTSGTWHGIIDQLVRDGKVLNPHLGITLSSVPLLDGLDGITLSSVPLLDGLDWLLVIDVIVDGPAAKAGLRKTDHHAYILGDIITSVNGKMVTNNNDLFKILDLCKEGDKVTVEVLRGGRKMNISVTRELNPDESESDVMLSTRKVFEVSAYKMNLSLFLCVNFFLLRGPES